MVAWLSLILGASIGAGANAYLTLMAIGLYARFGEAAPQEGKRRSGARSAV